MSTDVGQMIVDAFFAGIPGALAALWAGVVAYPLPWVLVACVAILGVFFPKRRRS